MNKSRGFTLVEVMVAMIILGFGMLGIAGMQLAGVRATQGSYYRSQAVAAMMDMAEKMRTNQEGAKGGTTATPNPAYVGFNSAATGCTPAPLQCANENGAAAVTCTPTQIATYDRFVMACGVRNGTGGRDGALNQVLPTGVMTVTCLPAAAACLPGQQQVITVSWTERGNTTEDAAATTTQTVSMTVVP